MNGSKEELEGVVFGEVGIVTTHEVGGYSR